MSSSIFSTMDMNFIHIWLTLGNFVERQDKKEERKILAVEDK